MTSVRQQGEQVRRFIIANVDRHPNDIARVVAEKFGISRQAANKHLARLVKDRMLSSEGNTRNRSYKLCPISQWEKAYRLARGMEEDLVWSTDIAGQLGSLPDNAMRIWQYGFTEMFNNVIDHSEAKTVTVQITRTAAKTDMRITDDGVGIFNKIKAALGLIDERHAILELSKGKLTTDPSRHSGEGIFFTSRMFDTFAILSGGVHFSHAFGEQDDWILEAPQLKSTTVFMTLNNHTARTVNKVFEKFTTDDDFSFSRTIVPVRLAQFGDDLLVSRSQARRMLTRIDRFSVVIFDFKGVREIGQAFADEVFRVFALQHPKIELQAINAVSAVKRMIARAQSSNVQSK